MKRTFQRLFLTVSFSIAVATAALAQAQLGAGNVWGNNTSAPRPAKDATLTSIIDQAISSTRGAMLERGSAGWHPILPSSTVGAVFISNGTGADPSYTTALTPASIAINGCSLSGGVLCTSGVSLFNGNVGVTGTLSIASLNGECFAVGPNGGTNPVFAINCAAASAANGWGITGNAAGTPPVFSVLSSASNESGTIQSKGTGALSLLGSTVTIGNANNAASVINLSGPTGGGVTVNIASASNGLQGFNVYNVSGSPQSWIPGGGTTTINFPTVTTALAGLAATQTWTGTQTFTGAVNATSPPSSSAANQYTFTVATGTATMNTSAIASGACATVVTVSATGVATTDVIDLGFNSDPTSTVGFTAPNMLAVIPYPTANNVNIKECNNTAASITPGAHTLNFRVRR